MKKFFVLMLLVASVNAFAQKSYITVYFPYDKGYLAGDYSIILTGDVPDNIPGVKRSDSGQYYYNNASQNPRYSLGGILNVLSGYGYEVEFATDENHIILSKETHSNQTIIEGDVNNDGEVTISDVNKVINIILGIVRENPSLLEQYGK